MSAKPIDVELARATFEYRDGKLYWRKRSQGRRAGKEVGGYRYDSRRHVRFNGGRYQVHRIIFAMHHGDPGSFEVDHSDGDPGNNRLENLRIATHANNMHNRVKPHKNNKSGFLGVCAHQGKWIAQIQPPGTGRQIRLGTFPTPEEASAAYQAARTKYFGEFA